MATITKPKTKKKPKRVIVKGIEHGLSGYTNYGCRCDTCTESNREHSRQYRDRRFAGQPLCVIPKCDSVQSRSYGNGLCWGHARQVLDFREDLEDMDRPALKQFIRRHGLKITILKRHTEEELRGLIEFKLGFKGIIRVMR